jgi:tRNA(adenine34) deaminase
MPWGEPLQRGGHVVKLDQRFIEHLMDLALEEAELARSSGEVPIGAVIAVQEKIVARAHNRMERTRDATAHAEAVAIREAGAAVGNWRLNDAVLCVTLEPCTMCAGAISLARIGTVVFGAADPRLGAYGSLYDLSDDERLGKPRVISGVKAGDATAILQRFFSERRRGGS